MDKSFFLIQVVDKTYPTSGYYLLAILSVPSKVYIDTSSSFLPHFFYFLCILPYWKKLMLSVLKVKRFQPDFAIFFAHFLPTVKTPQNSTRPLNFRQETLNILSALKFAGSHLASYE
jgi:hypothetical protein